MFPFTEKGRSPVPETTAGAAPPRVPVKVWTLANQSQYICSSKEARYYLLPAAVAATEAAGAAAGAATGAAAGQAAGALAATIPKSEFWKVK